MIRRRGAGGMIVAFAVAIAALPVSFVAQVPRPAATMGTGVVSGKVIDASTGLPLSFAEVVLSGRIRNMGPRVMVFAGEDGDFTFEKLAPGRYYLAARTATHPLAVFTSDGRAVSDPGDPIDLAPNARRDGVELRLSRGAAISGRVLDRNGNPAARARMMIVRRPWVREQDEVFYFPPRWWTADAKGNYRIFGLAAGDYAIGVDQWFVPNFTGTSGQPTSKYVRTFFPGVTDIADSPTVSLVSGQDRGGVDITLQYASLFRVNGTVTKPPEANVESIYLRLVAANREAGETDSVAEMGGTQFDTRQAPPGRYWLTAIAHAPSQESKADATESLYPPVWWAAIPVTVVDRDVTGLSGVLQSGMTVSGRIEIEGATSSESYGRWVIGMKRASPMLITEIPAPGQVDANGRFTIRNVTPGRFRLAVLGAPSPASVLLSVSGTSGLVPDGEIEITAGTNIDGLVVRVRR